MFPSTVVNMFFIASPFFPLKNSPMFFSTMSDSKTLTEAERENLFQKLHEANSYVGWALQILSPNTISTSMLQRYLAQTVSYTKHTGLFISYSVSFSHPNKTSALPGPNTIWIPFHTIQPLAWYSMPWTVEYSSKRYVNKSFLWILKAAKVLFIFQIFSFLPGNLWSHA